MSTNVNFQAVICLSYQKGLRQRHIRKSLNQLPTQKEIDQIEFDENKRNRDVYDLPDTDFDHATVVNIFPCEEE